MQFPENPDSSESASQNKSFKATDEREEIKSTQIGLGKIQLRSQRGMRLPLPF